MTKEFFHQQMKIIIENFKPDEYTPGRVAIIWEDCKDLPEKSFAWIVKHFLRTKSVKYPPLPEDFIIAATEQRKLVNDGWKKQPEFSDAPAPSGEALDQVLKRLGVPNLLEAVKKSREEMEH